MPLNPTEVIVRLFRTGTPYLTTEQERQLDPTDIKNVRFDTGVHECHVLYCPDEPKLVIDPGEDLPDGVHANGELTKTIIGLESVRAITPGVVGDYYISEFMSETAYEDFTPDVMQKLYELAKSYENRIDACCRDLSVRLLVDWQCNSSYDNETGFIEVEGYDFLGALKLLPDEPPDNEPDRSERTLPEMTAEDILSEE